MQKDRGTRRGWRFAFLFGVLLMVALLSISALGPPAWAQDDDLNCADFPSQAAAQREYEKDRSDPNNLDADNDGQACDDFDYSGSGTGGGGAADHQYRDGRAGARGAADNQYRKDEVIDETIPKKNLPDTSGPP
jgi:hypothetical protein